jgi:hypothetical protein
MPKDEFDFDDPLELNGVAIATDEDTQREMAECFVEEFLMLGHNHKQLLALFRNPHYLGMNLVLQNNGEAFVKEVISHVFARWGKKIEWPPASNSPREEAQTSPPVAAPAECQSLVAPASGREFDEQHLDPFGNAVPKLNL